MLAEVLEWASGLEKTQRKVTIHRDMPLRK